MVVSFFGEVPVDRRERQSTSLLATGECGSGFHCLGAVFSLHSGTAVNLQRRWDQFLACPFRDHGQNPSYPSFQPSSSQQL
jgi:hypothetical protein